MWMPLVHPWKHGMGYCRAPWVLLNPALSSHWQGIAVKTQVDHSRHGVYRMEEAWAGVRHVRYRMEAFSIQRQTQRTHNTDDAATLPSVAPLPFLSGFSKPVPPEGYRETSVGTGQLLAVSSVISYICPSIGCRCQFRPNRCMAVVSNEKSHPFLLEVEMELPSHKERGSGVGNTDPKFTSTMAPGERFLKVSGPARGLGAQWWSRLRPCPRGAHSLVMLGMDERSQSFRRSWPFPSKEKWQSRGENCNLYHKGLFP